MAEPGSVATLTYLVGALWREIHDHMQAVLRALDITEPVAQLLWLTDPDAAPVPLRQVAGRLHCDPSNVTLLCAKLEEKGLAHRRPHPADGRIRTLVLTEAGIRARAELMRHADTAGPFVALTEKERAALRELLTRTLPT